MSRLPGFFSGDCLRILANGRTWNIAFRTAHIAAMGVLLGGHVFSSDPKSDLQWSLWLCVGTGVALTAMEAGPRLVWFHQGRGLMTMAKLLLIAAVPFFWAFRLPILLVVVVIASVGSHMPARFRYYSVIYRQVLRCSGGPGTSMLTTDPPDSTH